MNHPRLVFTLPCLLALIISSAVASARASGQAEQLTAAISELSSARGPEAYTAVRKIWAEWGNLDPLLVERALNDAAISRRLEPDVRDYAGFFAAHARTRRGDVVGARSAIAQLGYNSKWLVVGPFDNEGKAGYGKEYGPEAQFGDPMVQGRAYSGKERAVRWRQVPPQAFPLGWLKGASLFRPEAAICFYATTFLEGSARETSHRFFLGSRGAFKFFVNGVLVLEDDAYRGHDVDRLSADIMLGAGKHRLTVKACGLDEAPVISLRVRVARSDQPPVFSAEFADSQAALANHGRAAVVASSGGPLRRFERLTEGKQSGAALLEAHARYLLSTHSDDPTQHVSRDLARRAAELEPTVERLLLAGELAEDYNLHRAWLEKAEALAREQGPLPVPVVLARAELEQSGLNWRDAFGYYRQVLELEPTNLAAIQGEVELLNRAGMDRSALKLLATTVERVPASVVLLNMYASQLDKLERGAEAAAVGERYAQYRLDDQNYLTGRLDLALARNNTAAAEHWIQRLIDFNPDSLWVYSHVAEAYRRLGQDERAVAAHEYALTLAPESVSNLRMLADLRGELGQVSEQLRLLHRVLELRPQSTDVQRYVEFLEPSDPKQDEAYAWEPDEFLRQRDLPARGENRRTLLDLTVNTVFQNGLGSEFRQVVFQPLTDAAAALSTLYYFHYEADRQRVQLRGARVFRGDGRVDEAIETGEGAADDPSIRMYTSARTYNIRFPRLEPGDVVELRYRIDDVASRNEFSDYFGDIQQFQSSESIGHAEYVLLTPKARKLYIDHQGIAHLHTEQRVKGDQRIYRFWADNVPPIVPEPSMPPWSEVGGFVHVSTFAGYKELGEWYWGLAQDQFDLDDETRKLVHKLADHLETEREKVNAIYDWVIRNTRYVALEFGIYGFKPRRCVQTVARGWGDCKDKATVIVSMLRELGIESTIVILRTQMRGRFKSKVASLAPFDHAIAYVPSLDLFLDGTAEYTGSGELPAMDQGALGILINRGDPKLVTLPVLPPEDNARKRALELRLRPDGSAELDAKFEVTGTRASSWRRRYNAESSRRERLMQDLSREFPGLLLKPGTAGIQLSLSDFERPVTGRARGDVPNFARQQGDYWAFDVTTRVRLTDEYASLSSRKLDVMIQSFGRVDDTVVVDLPPGTKVVRAPEPVKHESRFGSFEVSVAQDKNRVQVRSRIDIKVTRVSPREYRAWRAFCLAADQAMSAKLVTSR